MKKQFNKFCEFIGTFAVGYAVIALIGAGIGVFLGAVYVVTTLMVSLI